MTRVSFIMEQHLGHQTYYQNLRRAVVQDGRVAASWAPISYTGNRLLDKLPFVPRRLRGFLQGWLQVRQVVGAGNYDVAFFNTQVPAALAGQAVRRRPYVVATDITPLQYDRIGKHYNHRPERGGLVSFYKHYVNRAMFRGAVYLLPWSTWAAASLVQDYGVDPSKITIVPPGVDLAQWRPAGHQQTERLRILFVGGDLYRKGGETLLQAFRALPSGSAELHLVTRTRIEPEAGVYTYYDMQPNTPELTALYQSSDVFVLPTAAEAFGIAAIEASASGLATIATTVGGLVDIVADGETGYLIPVGDVGILHNRLTRLAEAPMVRAHMGRAARARAEQRFDAQRNAARIIEHLLEAARQARPDGTAMRSPLRRG